MLRVVVEAAARFRSARCVDAAAALAYTTLLALVPLAAIALAVATALPVFERFVAAVERFVTSTLVPEAAGRVIGVYLPQFAANAAGLTVIGSAALLVSALLLVHAIESAFDDIWRPARRRGWGRRLLLYPALLVFGPLLLGLGLWSASTAFGWLPGWLVPRPAGRQIAAQAVSLLLIVAAFTLLYRVLPNARVRWRHALIAAVLAGAGFEVARHAFGWFIVHVANYQLIYGAFAAFPIFLIWLFLCWLIVLAGAAVAAAASGRR
jgi:membrane protein